MSDSTGFRNHSFFEFTSDNDEYKSVYPRVANLYLQKMYALNLAPVRVEPPVVLNELQIAMIMLHFGNTTHLCWVPRMDWLMLLTVVQAFERDRGHRWTIEEVRRAYYDLCSCFNLVLETPASKEHAMRVLESQMAQL